jgi:hypothetical protein
MNAGACLELFGCSVGIPRVQQQARGKRRELRVPPFVQRLPCEVCGRADVTRLGES